MNRSRLIFNIVVLTATLHAGCVSVNIGPKKIEKSEGVRYRAPTRPFVAFQPPGADQAWKNAGNGNLISYLSTCNDPSDPSLETVQAEILAAFDEPRVIKSGEKTFNGREALRTEAEGLIDGIKTRLDLLVFKKNNCTYSLTYIGLSHRFAEDHGQFQAFVSSFEAP